MKLIVVTPPAIEPITLDEVRTYCRIDASNLEPAPRAFTAALASPAAPGNVDNGAHRWLATFVTAAGETQAGAPTAAVTVADNAMNGQVQLTDIPLGGSAVTARKIYRTQAGGATFLCHSTIADNTTTTLVDNTADSALGAGAPATNTTGDPLLTVLIAAARQAAETELGRRLITQTVDAYFDNFPGYSLTEGMYQPGVPVDYRRGDPLEIRLPPIQQVSAITYVDDSGVEQTLAADQYLVDAQGVPGRVVPAYGLSWPVTRHVKNAVKVRTIMGYGDAASNVPECIKTWMFMRIKTTWDTREQLASSDGRATLVQLPDQYVDGFLDPERVVSRL